MNKMINYSLIGLPFMIAYIILSSLISSTAWIWYLTRAFGLISFFFLFITIILGELRLLSLVKAKFKLFKYHVPVSIFTLMLVFLHFISAIFEKYKWGAGLTFSNYLGFSFGDKWLVFLSLGTLAMYLLIIVGATSMKKSIRAIGYKNWKLVHLFSYVSFIFAYIHTVNLGTDVKTSAISFFIKPLLMISFWLVIALLFVRVLISLKVFKDQVEVNITAIFFIILIVVGAFVATFIASSLLDVPKEKVDSVNNINADIKYYQDANNLLLIQNQQLQDQISNTGGS